MSRLGQLSAPRSVTDIVVPLFASSGVAASLTNSGVRSNRQMPIDGDAHPSAMCKCGQALSFKSLYCLSCPAAKNRTKATVKKHSKLRAFILPVDVAPFLLMIAKKIFRFLSLRTLVHDLSIIFLNMLPCVLDVIAYLARHANIDDETTDTATFRTRTLTIWDMSALSVLLDFGRFHCTFLLCCSEVSCCSARAVL